MIPGLKMTPSFMRPQSARSFLGVLATAAMMCMPVPSSASTQGSTPGTAESRPADGNVTAKPKVRAITAFVRLDHATYQTQIADAVKMLKYAKTVYESRGYEVQTIRISTQPFPEYTKGLKPEEVLAFFRDYDALAGKENFDASIGPAMLKDDDDPLQVQLLGEILSKTKILNGSVVVAGEDGIHWKAIGAAARLMKFLEENTEHSQGNFRFSAMAMVPTLTPFYPGSYHTGFGHQFAVALQSANVVEAAFRAAPNPEAAKRALSDALNLHAAEIERHANRIDQDTGWAYVGIDLSPAPLRDVSIGAAIEDLTKQSVGASGTLTAAALITEVLKSVAVKHAGYSGLMLPVLEDERLAQRWSEGSFSLDALLAYSAVCGTGLDVVPLPGDTSENRLALIIGDVASLAVKWHKPLSARLLPVAGKKAGDRTEFADPFLVNAIIQPLSSGALANSPRQP
ncbi:MAG TPA: DUF711 family protein [Candidatus Dormibacteraeota bacterium]|nr:DUF711 family protein [Candidatus Dormibacteraeota bacterium]